MADATGPGPAAEPPRYCLRCGTRLDAIVFIDDPQARCPRCGLPYDPGRPETYRHRRRHFGPGWAPALAATVVLGVVAYAAIRYQEQMGPALFFGVPFAIGAVLGYATNARFWAAMLLSLVAVACVVFALVSMSLTGIFCGLTLGAIFLGPALLGVLVGWIVRVLSGAGDWDRKRLAVLSVFVGLPFGAERVEGRFPMGEPVAEVSTSRTFFADAPTAWGKILFYEQVDHPPPFLLTLALPRPVRAEGRKDTVGGVARCVYQKGHLLKTITRCDPPRLLAFDVTEQHLHFEHDVTLLDGSFILEPLDDRRTRVVLTTRYRRLLRPAWLWEPMEREIIHTLHGHVLEGMMRHVAGRPPAG